VRAKPVDSENLGFTIFSYETDVSQEHFLGFETNDEHLAGFLRLSFPQVKPEIEELQGCAIVRDLHIYGPALKLSARQDGPPQHIGLGTQLLKKAGDLTRQAGFPSLAVIAAAGTRAYYRERGFELWKLYMLRSMK
jgi:elongator complex protein 3